MNLNESQGQMITHILVGVMVVCCLLSGYACSAKETNKDIRNLRSSNLMLKEEAMRRISEDRVKAALPILETLLRKDLPKSSRLLIIQAIGDIGEKNSAVYLIPLLNQQDADICEAAAEALGKIKDPRAIPSLAKAISEKKVRYGIIWALGNIGDKSGVPVLTPLLQNTDKYVSYNARQALKKIGSFN